MKTKDEVQAAWENLASTPEFEDCFIDLLRYIRFFKPLKGEGVKTEEYVGQAYQRDVATYILKKTQYKLNNIKELL